MNLKITTLAVALATSLSLSAHAEDLMDIYKEALQKDTQVAQAKADADAAHAGLTEADVAPPWKIGTLRVKPTDLDQALLSTKLASGTLDV